MTITLYVNNDDDRKLNKNLAGGLTIANANVYGDCSVMYPMLKLAYFTNISNYNYCYISEFGRYYYINDVVLMPGQIAIIKCSVDVLMSFKSEILSSYQTITRYNDAENANVSKSEVVDNLLPVSKNLQFMGAIQFRGSAWERFYHNAWSSDYSYLLQTVGGGSN